VKESGIAIARAISEMFVKVEYFSIALIERARARVMTRKNHSRITIFHLYFIRVKISAKARAKDNMRERNVGVGSSSGVCSPKGSGFDRLSICPVVSLMVGVYAFITKSPMNWVKRNIPRSIKVTESLCFILVFLTVL